MKQHAGSKGSSALYDSTPTPVRYYAEWLDGEYILLNQVNDRYNHFDVMELSLKLHALLGSTVVLSDIQMIDNKCPIPMLFANDHFTAFLKERQLQGQDFLALVADPVPGAKNEKFAIAMKGLERVHNQYKNRPTNSYDWSLAKLGEPIFKVDIVTLTTISALDGSGGVALAG